MPILDLEKLLEPLSEEEPSGEDLLYDPELTSLEGAAKGTPERVMGDSVQEAEPPAWRDIQPAALKLFERGKSVSTAIILTRALLAKHGVPGLAEGLELTEKLLVNFWDSIHPKLDEDDDDPTERLNTLVQVADAESTLKELSNAVIVSSPALGRYTIRDYLLASGKKQLAASSSETVPDMAAISGALMECELDQIKETCDSFQRATESTRSIQTLVDAKVPPGTPFDLSELVGTLTSVEPFIRETLERRGVVTAGADGEAVAEGGGEGGAAAVAAPGEIRSRDDVARMLDKACEYFNRNEPSSPVPMLLQRAKRLISQDFLTILQDIAPDGVTQAQFLSGPDSDSE